MKRKSRKHFQCRWCDQNKEAPVLGVPRVGKAVLICPGCRGPITK